MNGLQGGVPSSVTGLPSTKLARLTRFIKKAPQDKRKTLRFLARKGLASLPYLPIRLRFKGPSGEQVKFWWSYVSETDFADRRLLEYPGDDLAELRFVGKFLRGDMVFFDVGSFHGLYSVIAAQTVGSRGTVVAFEPSPREFSRLKLHLQLNGLSRVRTEPFAVSAQTGRTKLFVVVDGHKTMNSLVRPPTESRIDEVTIETLSLDAYARQNGISRIDLMKVDTEGAERHVFAGADRILSEVRPVIICEVLDLVTQGWGYPAREILGCLGKYDYTWFDFDEQGNLSPHAPRETYSDVRNYLAVPREKIRLIEDWRRE